MVNLLSIEVNKSVYIYASCWNTPGHWLSLEVVTLINESINVKNRSKIQDTHERKYQELNQ